MEAWLKDGTLPDGSKGVTRAVKIETESGEVLSARDRTEVHLIEDIAYHQKRIERWKPDLDVRTEEELLAEHSPEQLAKRLGDIDYKTHLLEVHARMIAWIPEVAGRIEVSQKTIRGFTSQLWTHRWKRAVEDTQAIHDESAAFLAELRGLSVDVFSWLIQGGYVVLYLSEKATKDGSRKWNDRGSLSRFMGNELTPLLLRRVASDRWTSPSLVPCVRVSCLFCMLMCVGILSPNTWKVFCVVPVQLQPDSLITRK